MRFLVLLAAPVLLLSMGCDSDCDNPSRMDGTYAVWSTIQTHDPAIAPDDYPSYEVLYNGWSHWSLTWSAAQDSLGIVLDEQEYTGAYEASSSSCNAFTLAFDGTYRVDDTFSTDFEWTGDLRYLGSCLAGTYAYNAVWTDSSGQAQQVAAEGSISGASVHNASDTGFCGAP